jgi:hypothetical protein
MQKKLFDFEKVEQIVLLQPDSKTTTIVINVIQQLVKEASNHQER